MNNKVIFNGEVLIDLTGDSVTPETLQNGITAHDKSGAVITGTSTKDSDTSDATIAVAEMLTGKTAYARGAKLTGTMPNNGAVSGEISDISSGYTIPQGYHDGSGKVDINSDDKQKLVASNIRSGIEILGVTGSYAGESGVGQSKTVTPTSTKQVITADFGYDYLTSVTVNKIPYEETQNSAGGKTVTIG